MAKEQRVVEGVGVVEVDAAALAEREVREVLVVGVLLKEDDAVRVERFDDAARDGRFTGGGAAGDGDGGDFRFAGWHCGRQSSRLGREERVNTKTPRTRSSDLLLSKVVSRCEDLIRGASLTPALEENLRSTTG